MGAAPKQMLHPLCVCMCVQALSAAEQGETDPLGRTSSTISLHLIMQSEAAGLFTTPASGKDGHALLAATIAKAQTDHEASQEAAIQSHADSAGSAHQGPADRDQCLYAPPESPREQLGVPLHRQHSRFPLSKSQSWDHGRPGSLGLAAHDAPVQMTGMHSGELVSMKSSHSSELTLATSPILATFDASEGA